MRPFLNYVFTFFANIYLYIYYRRILTLFCVKNSKKYINIRLPSRLKTEAE